MFYKVEIKDHIRVPPEDFNLDVEDEVIKRLREKYDGFISKDIGIVCEMLLVSLQEMDPMTCNREPSP